ncbi:DUF7935 family protein [Acidiluteibacter ferrifornacis]|uniref:Uncharacterized protein n=1 Tax=Acidiluteibacter ferrifornacis TaxID=2692424 RepID=A0A6N9NQX8_9FLAO|nr:hypothetical protein [Acidiluteibacter ferrifornacis]MBR9831573.1 hypothetical protein [bacterium]NBG66815.1 hypothetical protein [Acidiluteibacter ferrifornacis]
MTESILQALLFILPIIIVFIGIYFMMKKLIDSFQKKWLLDFRKESQKTVTPIKFQAYERIVLFLERISLENLVMRIYVGGMSRSKLHQELLKAIRTEYEHNLSQQVYVSTSAWRMVRTVKEENLKIVNTAASSLPEDASGMELSQLILKLMAGMKQSPSRTAIDYLKQEIDQHL